MKALKAILCSFLVLIIGKALLQVQKPTCAANEIPGLVNYTQANFGKNPYGNTLIGALIIPLNLQFCNIDQEENFSNLPEKDIKKFVLIKRGACKFTKKILNAQTKGADMVIVYDNEQSQIPDIVMSNDGHGNLISIPSIFISNTDGQKLIRTFQKCGNNIVLKIHFDVQKSQKANVIFWLDINNRESYITLREFSKHYHKAIQKYINYEVRQQYFYFRFKINQHCGNQQCETNCIKDNKWYCLSSANPELHISGKQLINQQLRSYFLFKAMKETKNLENWFGYMNSFDQKFCIGKVDLRQCSLDIIKNYIKPEQIESKVEQVYTNVSQGKQNIVLNFVQEAYEWEIIFFPQATINGRNFYGLFKASDIFEMICKSLEKPPTQCYKTNEDEQAYEEDHSTAVWKIVLLVIVLFIFVFGTALFLYNKFIRKSFKRQIKREINQMAQQYIVMAEEKLNKN